MKNLDRNGFRLGLDYFTHHRIGPEMSWADADKTPTMSKMFSPEMSRLLGPVRGPDEPLEQRHRNLAASLQARLEEVYLGMLRKLAKAHRPEIGLPCGRRGLQLRCQRKNF